MNDMGARRSEVVSQDASRNRPWIMASASAIGWALFTMVILRMLSSHNPIPWRITAEAGGALGSPTYHFPSQTGLLREAMLLFAEDETR